MEDYPLNQPNLTSPSSGVSTILEGETSERLFLSRKGDSFLSTPQTAGRGPRLN